MNPKISVIMPVYNSEYYLEDSVNSVLNQTFKDLELIIINDGSTDNSKKICEEFSKKDDRIKIFTIKNSGSAVARNVGLEKSKGDFIGFVDSDDYVEKEMFQKLYETAVKYKCEIVSCSFERVNEKEIKLPETTYLNEGYYNSEKIKNDIFPQLISTTNLMDVMPKTMWTKIFKNEFLKKNKVSFIPELKMSQDVIFTVKNLLECNNFYYLPTKRYYKYRYNKNSRTHTYLENAWEVMENNYHQIVLMTQNRDDFDFSKQLPYTLIRNAITSVTNEGREITFDNLPERLNKVRKICNHPDVIKSASRVKSKDFPLLKKVVFFLIKHKKYRLILLLAILYSKYK